MRIKKHLTRGAAASAVALVLAMSLSVSAFAYTDEAAETEKTSVQTATQEAEIEKIGTVTTNGSRLNLREGGSTDYSIIGQLVNGDTVTVVGEENGWYQVIVPEKKGYVCGDYLSVSEKTVSSSDTTSTDDDSGNNRNALTPDGNMQLVDDVTKESDGKQFITVQSKNDNTFYIVIDHDKDSDNVYFMNLVDEADLMALIEDGEVTVKCTCEERCVAGNVDTTCPVCKSDMTQCTGVEQEEPEEAVEIEPTEEPAQEDSGKTNMTPVLAVLLVMILGAGGAVYYLKLRKQKPDTKGSVDLDDYDFGDEDEDEEEEYISEDDLPETEESDDAEYDEE